MPTQDELTQRAEEEESEPWMKCGPSHTFDNQLRNELRAVLTESVTGNSATKMHKYLEGQMGKSQISYPTFKNFLDNKVKSGAGLAPRHRQVLQCFINMESSAKPAADNSL